jgi:RNA 2',3'-cyclic 3'-phosphodiesterase
MHQADLLGSNTADATTHRLFFALWPDAALRGRIATTVAALERDHATGGRRLNQDRYHLTLQFLGDFQPLRQSVLDAAIAAAEGVHQPAFDLVLDRAGSFPKAGVCWLGASAAPEDLQQLWNELGRTLAAARVQVRSASGFSPHLTILRDVRGPLPSMPIEPLAWPVREFALIDSVSGAKPGYRLLGRWPLQDRGSGR